MFKRPQSIAVALVAVLALVLLSLPSRTTDRLKLALGALFVPLFGLAAGTQQAAETTVDALTPRRELLRLNATLKRENQRLQFEVTQAAALRQENDRLRQLLDYRTRQRTWTLKPAHVVARDPASWWRAVHIDLGERDGLRENLPVLTTEGLVGKVLAVGQTLSQVVLLGDPNCGVSAVVENEARDMGTIGKAGGPFDGSFVELNHLSRNAALKPGQRVLSSGLGGVFPKGILIGTIADSRPVEFGLYTQAQVKLAANLGALQEVWVLLP